MSGAWRALSELAGRHKLLSGIMIFGAIYFATYPLGTPRVPTASERAQMRKSSSVESKWFDRDQVVLLLQNIVGALAAVFQLGDTTALEWHAHLFCSLICWISNPVIARLHLLSGLLTDCSRASDSDLLTLCA